LVLGLLELRRFTLASVLAAGHRSIDLVTTQHELPQLAIDAHPDACHQRAMAPNCDTMAHFGDI
jgi:hypothetical protein